MTTKKLAVIVFALMVSAWLIEILYMLYKLDPLVCPPLPKATTDEPRTQKTEHLKYKGPRYD